tara:strand:+ start:8554 stop:10968 length:2415 start_codon:yes stop_codon:yes gene_type:complete
MTHNPATAVAFLQNMHPHDLWLISAFPVDRTSTKYSNRTATFQAGEEKQLVEFLEAHSGGSHNIYFSVNPPVGPMTKKAQRVDIERMTFLHVDLDPSAGEPVAIERERILAQVTTNLPDGVPPPTMIVDSGGGYWAFWRLEDAFDIEGSSERYEEAKLWNLQLELLFGADSCHNVDRIARLPGTVNYPDAKKASKGRTARLSTVFESNRSSFKLSEFTKAPQVQAASGFSSGKTVTISENVQRVMDLAKELPASVPNWCKVVIAQGKDPDDETRFVKPGSSEVNRSDALFYTVCELVRNQVSDDMIYAIITDPDWAISASVIDGSNGRGDRYARRQIERAHEFAVDPQLADLNNRYAVVQNAGNGKCKIIYEDVRTHRLVQQAPADFRAFYSNKFIEIPTSSGAVARIPLGKWWFEHSMRRSFRSIDFLPGEEVAADVYNLWRGFAYEALPGGSCDLYLDHVREVICSGDPVIYDYLLNWMAQAVQKPSQPGHTAIVMRGSQGAGKGTFAKTFAKLFGHHGKQITDAKHLVGSFNAHLRDCIVLFADEAIAAGNKQHESMLKTMVTEETLMVELKGVDASVERNYLHVIMASNAEWVVPTGTDDRRFVMLDVSDDHVMDANYWAALNSQLRNGGYQALLHTLLTRDLSGFDPRRRPQTDALQDQKQRSFDPQAQWWFSVLQEGTLSEVSLADGALFPSGTLTYEYNVTRPHGERISVNAMHAFMMKVAPRTTYLRQATQGEVDTGKMEMPQRHPYTGEDKTTSRPMVFHLSTLANLRVQFDDTHGGPYDWHDVSAIVGQAPEVF